jgi:hypothetical protein
LTTDATSPEKGTSVKPSERNAHKPSTATGLLACLRAFPGVKGSAAPSTGHGRRFALLSALPLALLATLVLSVVSPAAASATPGKICEESLSTGNFMAFGGTGSDTVAAPKKKTLTSVVFSGQIYRECETKWLFQWSTGKEGPWEPMPGGSGTVAEPLLEKTATNGEEYTYLVPFETGELTGLEPETTYYERGTLTDLGGVKQEFGSFQTRRLAPLAYSPQPVSGGIAETSARLRGSFSPAPFETEWRVEYAASEGGPWTLAAKGSISQVEAEALQTAASAYGDNVEVDLTGLSPESTYYARVVAEDEPEWPVGSGIKHHKEATSQVGSFKTAGRPLAGTFALHALQGESSMYALGWVVPDGFDTHYRFEYLTQEEFGVGGFSNPAVKSTPELDVGSGGAGGTETSRVGAELPGLQAGKAYHYRIVASSEAAGGSTVYGNEHTLTVPVPAPASEPAACPTARLRVGPSASLPACRAYEEVTPVDKEGAFEPFNYTGTTVGNPGTLVGEDGDHFMVRQQFTHWGSAGGSPYFFSRTGKGWQMTPGTPQPEAGIDHYDPELFSPDLTSFAFAAGWATSTVGQSPEVEFRAGAPGGSYATAASVPRAQVESKSGKSEKGGWVAASEDFSKLILETEDRALVPGRPSSTSSGFDLYEYSGGELRQLNLTTGGSTIGACGATMSTSGAESSGSASKSSHRGVSADGSRVFFEAVPGSDCSEPKHLYMRVGGGDTVDLGVYEFVAANAGDTQVLLEARSGETQEVVLYDTSSATAKRLFSLHQHLSGEERLLLKVSEDFSTIYLSSSEHLTAEAPPTGGGSRDLYRYDIPTETLSLVGPIPTQYTPQASPDGRFLYFTGRVAGFPAGTASAALGEGENTLQAMLYDSAENLVECVSCASSFDPEPKQGVQFAPYYEGSGVLTTLNGTPRRTVFSADGSRAFFDTTAALLPADIDGEIAPQGNAGAASGHWSPSSDVYEWRRDGTEGCAHVQGCLSLISTGRGGYLVLLLGIANEGRDVFFTTRQSLVPQDPDTAIDVYDARIGGGFPPPATRPVECEGDACSTPFAAPSDLTPSTSTFQGAGNVLGGTLSEVKPKPKKKIKAKKKKTKKKKGKAKAKKKTGKKATNSNHRRGK